MINHLKNIHTVHPLPPTAEELVHSQELGLAMVNELIHEYNTDVWESEK